MNVVIVAVSEEKLINMAATVSEADSEANIITFTDGIFALKYLFHNSADIILTEDAMRHLRVDEFLRLARQKQPYADISVISRSDAAGRAMRLGADRLLGEPLTAETVGSLLKARSCRFEKEKFG